MKEKLYILLPVHNRREITRRFISCLNRQSFQNFHLVLIDDGSTDGTVEMVTDNIEALTVIRGRGDWWWGGALHQGFLWLLKHAISDDSIILMMNDDTEFDSDFIAEGLSFLEMHQRTLLMAQCFDMVTKSMLDHGVHVDWRRLTFKMAGSAAELNCLATRGLFLRMSDFREIGGFHPRLIPHYLSDYEFTIRGRRKGMQLCTTSSVMLRMDKETTGLQTVDTTTVNGFIRSFLSFRSVHHLRTWTFFVLLTCPLPWIPLNLLRIYWNPCKSFCLLIKGLLFAVRGKTAG